MTLEDPRRRLQCYYIAHRPHSSSRTFFDFFFVFLEPCDHLSQRQKRGSGWPNTGPPTRTVSRSKTFNQSACREIVSTECCVGFPIGAQISVLKKADEWLSGKYRRKKKKKKENWENKKKKKCRPSSWVCFAALLHTTCIMQPCSSVPHYWVSTESA